MGARGHGQEGAFALLWKQCKVFLCISSYSKTLSKRIIHALFSQTVVGFWGQSPRPPPVLYPWTLLGNFCLQTSNLPTPGKNLAGAHVPMAHVEGWGRSTLYQRIRKYTLRSQSGSDMMTNYDLRNGA